MRTALIGVLAYASLVLLLRISGRRTLSKMNAFDFIVTVALGSTLATVLLNTDISLAEGVIAFAVLIGLQFAVTWSSVRVRWVRRLVTGEPALLFFRGEFLPQGLRSARVTEEEVRAAVRATGRTALENIEAVVLETDGSFSVIGRNGDSRRSSLAGVRKPWSDGSNSG
ncbi:MAG: YetF domain-containing protein [Woeseia sp.]